MVLAKRNSEWIGAGDAALRIAGRVGGEKAAQDVIAGWIGDGKLPTRASAIESFPSIFENQGDDDLSKIDAIKRGFAKYDSSTIVHGAFEITDRFWGESRQWADDYAHWNWDKGNFVVGYQFAQDASEPTYWMARRVQIKTRALDFLMAVWDGENQVQAPPPASLPVPVAKRKGRKVDPRRDDWTGQVVLMALKGQIRPSMKANELIEEVARQLTVIGVWGDEIDALDRSTVYGSAEKVLAAVRIFQES